MRKLNNSFKYFSLVALTLFYTSAITNFVYADAQPRTASETLLEFNDPLLKTRYYNLLEKLRCLVCQNQSLADSGAGLAQDLRQQVYNMLNQGKTDAQIADFMVERYGDFVLYDPPLNLSTLLLWFGPFLLVGIGLCTLLMYLYKRNKQQPVTTGDSARQQRAAHLLSQRDNLSNENIK